MYRKDLDLLIMVQKTWGCPQRMEGLLALAISMGKKGGETLQFQWAAYFDMLIVSFGADMGSKIALFLYLKPAVRTN